MHDINTFDDTLNPELLEKGRHVFDKKGIKSLTEEEKNEWVGVVKDDTELYDVFLRLANGSKVRDIFCSCPEFAIAEDLNLPESDHACAHSVAVLYALQEKMTKAGVLVKNKLRVKTTEPKTPSTKDAALKLLDDLEPKDLKAFIKDLFTKDVGFRSTFMMHFSEREEVDDNQYRPIIQDAIKSVRGRKKYLDNADSSKIATKINGLFEQAVKAEAKGEYLVALSISLLFFQELEPLAPFFKSISVKFTKLLTRNYDLLNQLATNPKTHFEFRQTLIKEVFAVHQAEWLQSKSVPEISASPLFLALVSAAKFNNRMNLLLDWYKTQFNERELQAKKSKSIFSKEVDAFVFALDWMIFFHENVMDDVDAAFSLAFSHKNTESKFEKAWQIALEKKDVEKVNQCLAFFEESDISRKTRYLPWEYGPFSKSLVFESLILVDKGEQAAKLAEDRLLASKYMQTDFLLLIKEASTPELWAEKLQEHLTATEGSRAEGKLKANYWLLNEGFEYDALYAKLKTEKSIEVIVGCSKILRQDQPERFAELFRTKCDEIFPKNARDWYYYKNSKSGTVAILLEFGDEFPAERPWVKETIAKYYSKYADIAPLEEYFATWS